MSRAARTGLRRAGLARNGFIQRRGMSEVREASAVVGRSELPHSAAKVRAPAPKKPRRAAQKKDPAL